MTISVWDCFWVFYFISLAYVFGFVHVQYLFCYYGSVIQFEIKYYDLSNIIVSE